MKIGILTQPLHTNYGGLLQAWALQAVLKRMGHEPWIVRRVESSRRRRWRYVKYLVKCALRLPGCYVHSWQQDVLERHTSRFVSLISPKTEKVGSSRALARMAGFHRFQAYVVGSDQVWRPRYSPGITDYFLGFCQGRRDVKRVAYAASFGVDGWEFTLKDTVRCARLAGLFDAVSVREDSAVRLCAERLGVSACHVLDPTLLLEKNDYEELVRDAGDPSPGCGLFYYVLDESEGKRRVVEEVSRSLSLPAFTAMPSRCVSRANLRHHLEECVFPPVTSWLRGFMDSECVVTDSFHGCVFSIIFHRPFWVVGNEGRGMARFQSLLSLFGLEDRLLLLGPVRPVDYARPIDWEAVDRKKKEMQRFSMDFLYKCLNDEG